MRRRGDHDPGPVRRKFPDLIGVDPSTGEPNRQVCRRYHPPPHRGRQQPVSGDLHRPRVAQARLLRQVADQMRTELRSKALSAARTATDPLVKAGNHSDHGARSTSKAYSTCEQLKVTQSMGAVHERRQPPRASTAALKREFLQGASAFLIKPPPLPGRVPVWTNRWPTSCADVTRDRPAHPEQLREHLRDARSATPRRWYNRNDTVSTIRKVKARWTDHLDFARASSSSANSSGTYELDTARGGRLRLAGTSFG